MGRFLQLFWGRGGDFRKWQKWSHHPLWGLVLSASSFPGGWSFSSVVKNLPAMQDMWVWSLCWEVPLERKMATLSSILAWRIPMDRGAWRAIVHGVAKRQTQLTLTLHTSTLPLLKHMLQQLPKKGFIMESKPITCARMSLLSSTFTLNRIL